jgi:hypothetical protein
MADFKLAARLMRPLLDAIESEDADKALATCEKIRSALGADDDEKADDETPKRKSGGYPEFLDTKKDGALAARNVQRAKMGLPAKGVQPKAIRRGVGEFKLSHHALAQSKNGRARA